MADDNWRQDRERERERERERGHENERERWRDEDEMSRRGATEEDHWPATGYGGHDRYRGRGPSRSEETRYRGPDFARGQRDYDDRGGMPAGGDFARGMRHDWDTQRETSGVWNAGRDSAWGGVAGPHMGKGPRGYRRTNERILEDVCERLTQHGRVDATDINVTVGEGTVTLTGTVPDRESKRLAEDIVESVSGVNDVQNQLRVKSA